MPQHITLVLTPKQAADATFYTSQAARRMGVSEADIALAVTGFAGPGGGTKNAPVGTVWFAIAVKDDCFTRSFRFEGDRDNVRAQTVCKAVELLTEGTENYL